MKYKRTLIGENIGFSSIIDEKFKTNCLRVHFLAPIDEKTAADRTLAAITLSDTSKKYNTVAKLNEKLSELYGSSVYSGARRIGNLHDLSLHASWIDNAYAIDGEDISAEVLDIFCGCLFEPNAENGAFDEEAFRITKKELIDRIEDEINNKRGYAITRAGMTAFKGEPAALAYYGTKESVDNITPESAYNAYLDYIKSAQIEIYYVSPKENPSVMERLKAEFDKISGNRTVNTFISPSPLKAEVERVSETFDVNQSKMVMVFKTDCTDHYALKLMNMIYGSTPVSKLFMNVREKLSLCYYCSSRILQYKGAVMIDSGVEKENIQKAEDEILHQLEEMQNGNFSDDDINNAMLSLENALIAVGDTPSSYTSWYFDRNTEGNELTPQEILEKYRSVSRQDIIDAAKSMKLDTVYLMLTKEVQE